LGAYTVQQAFGLAAIGGKDSMSGTFENINVPPTLVSFAVTTSEADKIISPEFKQPNSHVVLLLPNNKIDMTTKINHLKSYFDVVHKGIMNKQILSAYALKQFGVAEGLAKMVIGNHIGMEFNKISMQELFGINYGGLIIEIDGKYHVGQVLQYTDYKLIGTTNDSGFLTSTQYDFSMPIDSIVENITDKLKRVFAFDTESKTQNVDLPIHKTTKQIYAKNKVAKPLVVIPVFPGTNCEFDSQRAFEKVGAKVQQVLILNKDAESLLNSIDELANVINKANIIMIPGGFSAADEPDGSAKFIVNVFKHKKIKEAVTNLLDKRDGLIIGICNGFQALIKLGLLPYGKIMDVNQQSPTLTFNEIHHHMSTLIRTKIVSNKSP
jgi:phosphoribosylformylglycinamidine synthase